MVIARLLINSAKGIAIDKLVDNFASAYRRHKLSQSEHSQAIDSYNIRDTNYFKGGQLKEISQRYGLDERVSEYKQSLFKRVRDYLAELKDLTSYLKNAYQNQGRNPIDQSAVYAKIHRSLNLMYGLLGQKPLAQEKYSYLSDVINDYTDKIGDVNRKLDKFLAVASGFHPDGAGIMGANAKKVAKFTIERVLESRGIPAHSLEKIISSSTQPFAELRKTARPLFADYRDVVKNMKAYASDLDSGVYGQMAIAA